MPGTQNETAAGRFAYLHGFASSSRSFKGLRLRERFARCGLRLELPDLNQPSFAELTYSSALAAFDAIQDGRPWCLIGSSLGGYLAARWAELHPGCVQRMVLLCPGFDLPRRWPQLLGEQAWQDWQRKGFWLFPDATGVPTPVSFGLVEDALQHPALPEVSCPTLLIHGRQDAVVPIDGSRQYARGRPHVRLLELDDDHGLASSVQLLGDAVLAHFGKGSAPRGSGNRT